jgi:hypothetical protein
MSNYTKGEWLAIDNGLVAILRKSRYLHIADCNPGNFLKSDIPQNEVVVNAQLISSAPDMYEALKALLTQYSLALLENHITDTPTMLMARNAIAKAEGK